MDRAGRRRGSRHWAFIPPKRPAGPEVKNGSWARNPIDSFVLARLEKEGLEPSPEADRPTLIRRLSFDLTGLPPTLQEIDAFVNDRSPNAYEKVVDRLLASPRYGERMAFRWLDAARYGDTNGYQVDGDREMWRWRDWVIEAFNRNMPFNQFVIEQLAGDLLPNPTLDQRIATGFNRNHRGNSEDGLVPEEYANEYVVDRVDTVSTVFMGLTIGCARCHNHKYDPFTQKEYYQLYAYFNSIPRRREVQQLRQLGAMDTCADQRTAEAVASGSIRKLLSQGSRWIRRCMRPELQQQRWEKSLLSSHSEQWFPTDELVLHQAFDEGSSLVVHDVRPPSRQ